MRKSVWYFMGTQGTWNLGLSYTMTGTFPAVPAVYGKHVSLMVVAQLQSPITPGTCPSLDSSMPPSPLLWARCRTLLLKVEW